MPRMIHGNQEGRFFHGYYREYCYLPLYIVCGELVLCARLRSSNIEASAGALEEVKRIVAQIQGRRCKLYCGVTVGSAATPS